MAERLLEAGCQVTLATWADASPERRSPSPVGLTRIDRQRADGDLVENFPAGSFDVVVLDHVVACVEDAGALLASVRTLLRAGGRVVVTAFNAGHGSLRLAQLGGRWSSPAQVNHCADAVRCFDSSSMVSTLAESGLRVDDVVATVVDPLDAGPIAPGGLPPVIVEWLRDQPDAFDHELVVTAHVDGERSDTEPSGEVARAVPPETVRRRDEHTRAVLTEASDMTDLRHRLLTMRDAVIGLEADAGASRQRADLAERRANRATARAERLREKATKATRRLRRAEARATKSERQARRTRRELAGELEALRSSRTFRAGRALTAPARVLRKKG